MSIALQRSNMMELSLEFVEYYNELYLFDVVQLMYYNYVLASWNPVLYTLLL